MRGTPGLTARDGPPIGIIPAYAGNTSVQERRPVEGGDHPRVCGEHIYPLSVRNGWQGSSPRMRGTPRLPRPVERGTGIIPAPFGSTGSSPRMRGTLHVTGGDAWLLGIIPAYAGNTATGEYPSAGIRDHPRVCGEHFDVGVAQLDIVGSSPRMRGTRHGWRGDIHAIGIIPAYAGNTHMVTGFRGG